MTAHVQTCKYDYIGDTISPCVTCTAQDFVAAAPARTVVDPLPGWNAGANSVQMLAGDLRIADTYTVGPKGVVLGLKPSRKFATDPFAITHGLYFTTTGGFVFVQVQELGAAKTVSFPYTLGTLFEIRRVKSVVSYWLDGKLVYTSLQKSTGAVLVNACLYIAGDLVP